MKYEEDYDPSEARWMRKLMRDPFQLLLEKVRAGEFITPAFFHKCTIPHSYHCFKRYHFRPNPFDQYMRKHKVPLRASTAAQLHKLTLSALSRLAKSGSAGVSPAVQCNAGFLTCVASAKKTSLRLLRHISLTLIPNLPQGSVRNLTSLDHPLNSLSHPCQKTCGHFERVPKGRAEKSIQTVRSSRLQAFK